ncbi:MAG TPA: sigma-70 family RNA polymerase sigma factor [Gemmataceae bacterium]|nr:sigma-70 family RNA polymerase sigma factor [Gemmataceae bacterium]
MTVPSPATSTSLLEQARERCAGAWERLVAVYTPLLNAWLTAAGLQSADREDVTQRVLEILVRQLSTFKHNGRPGAFRAWLRAITVNLLREFWRSRPQPEAGTMLEQLSDSNAGLSRLWDEQHDRHVLHGLMNLVRPEFTEATWQAFRRLALDEATTRDVAAELGLSVNAVLIAKSRVLARLRQEARGLID